MASKIPGYEYDTCLPCRQVFISYRQKNDKGDKYFNKFVDAFKIGSQMGSIKKSTGV